MMNKAHLEVLRGNSVYAGARLFLAVITLLGLAGSVVGAVMALKDQPLNETLAIAYGAGFLSTLLFYITTTVIFDIADGVVNISRNSSANSTNPFSE